MGRDPGAETTTRSGKVVRRVDRPTVSGFRAFDAVKMRQLGLKAPGMEFAFEMLIRTSREGRRIEERPTGYRPRVGDSKLDTLADRWRHLQLILLLSPQVLLLWPGVTLLVLGVLLSALSLLNPVGFDAGALHWQPIFLAPILVVLGSMGALSGAVIAHHSTLAARSETVPFSVVGHPRFARPCITTVVVALVAGMSLDLLLFALWVGDGSSPSSALALAGAAQSLVIIGVGLGGFGLLHRILVVRKDDQQGHPGGKILPLNRGPESPSSDDEQVTPTFHPG